ncbi:pyruvate kinase [Lonepinella sp. BR2271]|uniref:pyruvate kinase n=1 Tax=Lonepinella sp. BR2271 TaxID=3434550 RepID=UPI003F6E1331
MLEEIQFWHMQMFPSENQEFVENVPSILQHKQIIGIGGKEDERQIQDFCYKMQVNDVVAIKNGKQLVALVQVIGGEYLVANDDSEISWMNYRRPIRLLDWALGNEILPHFRNALTFCDSDDAETTKIIKDWWLRVKKSFIERKLNPTV